MSEHAKQWLNEWVRVRVSAAPYQQQKRQATDVYGPACSADALKAGITRRELKQAADGDLLSYLESAVEDKMDVEVRKNRPAI
jgi:hypothetical protein